MRSITKAALCTLILATVTAGRADETQPVTAKIDASYVFARGDYGLAQDTDVSVFLLNPTVETGSWRFQASIPYVSLDGPATVVGNTGPTTVNRSESGLGDLTLGATHRFATASSGWTTELTGKVKLPTADDAKGLGTGEIDYIVQADFFLTGGKITPFATLGYQVLGKSTDYPMESGVFTTVGLAGSVSTNLTIGGGLNWRQRIVTGGDAGVEAMAFVQHKFSDQRRVQVFALKGFTEASPDLAIGATLGFSF